MGGLVHPHYGYPGRGSIFSDHENSLVGILHIKFQTVPGNPPDPAAGHHRIALTAVVIKKFQQAGILDVGFRFYRAQILLAKGL